MPSSDLPPHPVPGSLARDDGTVLAYYKTTAGKASSEEAAAPPGIVFLGGFMSAMSGIKALALEAYARRCGRNFVRFDYRGHGASAGRFEDATIGDRSEEHTSELQSLMRISYAVFCLKQKQKTNH